MSTKKITKSKKKYPIYGGDLKGIKPGLYLGLFHGFRNENKRAASDGWGANGPMIGPLQFVHTTYGNDVKFKFINSKDAAKYGLNEEDFLAVNKDDTIEFRCMKYGDWTVFNVTKEDVV